MSRSSELQHIVHAQGENGGVAVAVWSAEPAVVLAVETDLADFDEFEVRVYDTSDEQRLVAAIELISPGNKDRPAHRSQFTAKCTALLRQGVSLVLVDVVTARNVNLYADLLELFEESDRSLGEQTVRYLFRRLPLVRHAARTQILQAWNSEVTPGLPLPEMPLVVIRRVFW